MIYALDGIRPEIGRDVWIAPAAHVIGKVALEDEVGIWFGVTIRGDNELIRIGRGSNVQENCVLHTDMGFPLTVGADCTIGHKAMLHGCTIGDGTLIGMGATILNGAVIGSGCLIGAGALVTEGKHIPDGSLVMGAPGRVVRELDAEVRARLLKSAEGYRTNARRFAAGLRDI
ncbi:gamma carbonic anhydrase family protein [Frigidibacter sp. RF13]|uniref:gamma carbonic anhydrase family protein n=1 Tax=Frigidibacter sp. RF13 TaxID=2997340 RepID=UPI0022701295|nr:gamma carbonic anhydrase family protein [Frigidibacter sp. RF13]MCY1125433.1 gamma carbonic anhydrase family protein [Frigidibacter sp. RF13]